MSLLAIVRIWSVLLVLFTPFSLQAANYYVAPTGSDSAAGAGTEAAPFATVGRAQTAASAGDTVFIRGGTYTISGTTATVGVSFTKSGTQAARINYFAYPGEIPIFDLTGLLPQARVTGFDVNCSWIHIRGIELKGTQQIIVGDSWGVRIRGSNNIIEHMNVHHGEAPGFFITSGANNLILNCDSHHNYDPLEGGGNGDGFGCHSTGGGNVISGCRGYANSDDGYDFINAPGSCTAEKSWAFNNGYIPDTTTASGNGAGFKAGGYGLDTSTFPATVPRHAIKNCVAFGNRSQGFYANHHPGGIDFFNNTAFRNSVNYNMLADVGASSHKLRNNIAMTPGTAISNLSGGTATFNSWTLAVTVSSADFASVAEAEALAPRQADGSLPNVNFMRLVAGSDLIDKGEDVGLPFVGSAPDLGAYEFGATNAGGMTSTGGATAGGATAGGTAGRGGAANGGAGSPSGGANSAGSAGGPRAGAPSNGGAVATGGASTAGTSTTTGGTATGPSGGASTTGGTATGPSGGTSTTTGGVGTAPTGGTPGQPTGTGGASTTGGSNGIPAAGAGSVTPPAESGGCSCSSARRSGSTSAALASFLLVGLAWRRRVRRAPRSSRT